MELQELGLSDIQMRALKKRRLYPWRHYSGVHLCITMIFKNLFIIAKKSGNGRNA